MPAVRRAARALRRVSLGALLVVSGAALDGCTGRATIRLPSLRGVPAPVGDEIPATPARRPDTVAHRCDLTAFDIATGSGADAGPAIRACLAGAESGDVIAFSPGRFRVETQVVIDRPLWLTSGDLEPDDAPCELEDRRCAAFVAAETLLVRNGFFTAARDTRQVVVDHLIFDGHKWGRQLSAAAEKCSGQHENRYGYNVGFFACRDCWFLNSVSMNALCGTALEVGATSVAFSRFVDNGLHRNHLWADGVTALECPGKAVYENYFEGNTDIDLVIGTGPCEVIGNTIVHRADFDSSAFSAINLFTFALHREDHAGTRIGRNTIDCGQRAGCGTGMYVGNEAWANPELPPRSVVGPVFIYDNAIVDAPAGMLIDSGTDIRLTGNRIYGAGGFFFTGCGDRPYPIASRSETSTTTSTDESFDYEVLEWEYCIPNFVH
jgi:hypothetical protein